MPNPNPNPESLVEIIKTYGDPLHRDFGDKFLVWQQLPYPMSRSWGKGELVTRVRVHKDVWESLSGVLSEIQRFKGFDYLLKHSFNILGGLYEHRYKVRKHPQELSLHSWGIAIDLNPQLAPQGKVSYQPDFIVKAFENRGWYWGGHFPIVDGMHFQKAEGY